MTTDYERGRLAGYAEGVEAAARRVQPGDYPECCPGDPECLSKALWQTRRNLANEIRALRAPSPAAGANEGACSCGGITQAPEEWAWEGGVLHTFSVCLIHAGKVSTVPPCRESRRAPSPKEEP